MKIDLIYSRRGYIYPHVFMIDVLYTEDVQISMTLTSHQVSKIIHVIVDLVWSELPRLLLILA